MGSRLPCSTQVGPTRLRAVARFIVQSMPMAFAPLAARASSQGAPPLVNRMVGTLSSTVSPFSLRSLRYGVSSDRMRRM